MTDDKKKANIAINDSELKDVAGGAGGTKKITIGGWVICNEFGSYKSGDAPKYNVGDRAKLKGRQDDGWKGIYHDFDVEIVRLGGKFGMFCPEYYYTIKIVDAPLEGLKHYIGHTISMVYESKLF